jgi:serpin B
MSMSDLKRIVVAVIFVALMAPVVAGCAQGKAQAQIAQSDVQRDALPGVPRADLDALVDGNSTFAFDLYQALRDTDGNLFFSPYSISAALAMTFAGARGETERQMAETLHFTLPQDRLHPSFNALDLELVGEDQGEFKLHIANSIWGQIGYSFLTEFLDLLARNYGAGLRLLDFENESEASRQVINNWVSDQTEEKIKDLIPQGGITPNTSLVLANAIYFDADWLHPFEKAKTHDGQFNTLGGGTVTVPMMAMAEPQTLSYAQSEGYQAIELIYKGREMSMVILVPDAGEFEAFEADLNAERLQAILDELEPKQVALTMPKFTFESEFSLAQTLSEMGMPDAFGAADFSGMDGTRNLFIGEVFHKAFVAVDEVGTEAAAATAVIMERMSVPIFDVELVIDRPFVFLIRDMSSGTVLFVGRVVDPMGD